LVVWLQGEEIRWRRQKTSWWRRRLGWRSFFFSQGAIYSEAPWDTKNRRLRTTDREKKRRFRSRFFRFCSKFNLQWTAPKWRIFCPRIKNVPRFSCTAARRCQHPNFMTPFALYFCPHFAFQLGSACGFADAQSRCNSHLPDDGSSMLICWLPDICLHCLHCCPPNRLIWCSISFNSSFISCRMCLSRYNHQPIGSCHRKSANTMELKKLNMAPLFYNYIRNTVTTKPFTECERQSTNTSVREKGK
jgi:hypothetical protein